MEVFKAGEALLRSQQQLLLPFLAPTASRTGSITQASRRCWTRQWQTRAARSLTTSRPRLQEESDRYGSFQRSDHSSSDSEPTITSSLDSALDFDKGTRTAPSTRTSHFKSPSAQSTNPPSRSMNPPSSSTMSSRFAPRPGSATEEFFAAMGPVGQRQRPDVSEKSADDITRMLDPNGRALPRPEAVQEPLAIELGPSAGRRITVNLDRNMDVGRAFRTLESQCTRNSVRKDVMRQRFHERPGLKRKRLKSERWRRRFRAGFKGVVALVQKMRKQGW